MLVQNALAIASRDRRGLALRAEIVLQLETILASRELNQEIYL